MDRSFLDVARRGYDGILTTFVSVDEGGVHLNRICAVAGLGGKDQRDGSFAFYIGEPVVSNDPKGVGPFILASLEVDRLVE